MTSDMARTLAVATRVNEDISINSTLRAGGFTVSTTRRRSMNFGALTLCHCSSSCGTSRFDCPSMVGVICLEYRILGNREVPVDVKVRLNNCDGRVHGDLQSTTHVEPLRARDARSFLGSAEPTLAPAGSVTTPAARRSVRAGRDARGSRAGL